MALISLTKALQVFNEKRFLKVGTQGYNFGIRTVPNWMVYFAISCMMF